MDRDVTLDPGTSRQIRTWLHETADELPDDPALFAGIKASLRAPRPRPWAGPCPPGDAPHDLGVAGGDPGDRDSWAWQSGCRARMDAPRRSGRRHRSSPMPLPDGSVPPGRYSFPRDAAPLVGHYDVSLDVPAGWSTDNGGWVLTKGGDAPAGATVEVDIIERIMVDPCLDRDVTVDVPPGSSPESFAGILTSWGSETTGRTSDLADDHGAGVRDVRRTAWRGADRPDPGRRRRSVLHRRPLHALGRRVRRSIYPGCRRIDAGPGDPGRLGAAVPRRRQLRRDARRRPRGTAGDARLGAHLPATGTFSGAGLTDARSLAQDAAEPLQ